MLVANIMQAYGVYGIRVLFEALARPCVVPVFSDYIIWLLLAPALALRLVTALIGRLVTSHLKFGTTYPSISGFALPYQPSNVISKRTYLNSILHFTPAILLT